MRDIMGVLNRDPPWRILYLMRSIMAGEVLIGI